MANISSKDFERAMRERELRDNPDSAPPPRAQGERVLKPIENLLNKTERRYLRRLELLLAAGQIERILIMPFRIRLADGLTYLPDFLVVRSGGKKPLIIEVKGFEEEDAVVKFKMAVEMLGFLFDFVMVSEDRKAKSWFIRPGRRTEGAELL